MMRRRACLLIVLSLSGAPALAEIYRWVDEQGQIRYSQTPPPVGTTFQLVYPPPPPPDPSERRGMEAFLAEREARREHERQQAETQTRLAQQRREACEAARKRLSWLESRPPFRLAVGNPQGGYTRMTVEQHARETEQAQQAADDNCG